MLYLKIENPGSAPVESFTLFGATSKRGAADKRIIGTFGSGGKHSIGVLLRHDINPTIFCGNLKLSFYTRPVQVTGVDSKTREHQKICVRYGGQDDDGKSRTSVEELSVSLDYGTASWATVNLGLREFVSNAIDACYEQGLTHDAVTVEVVDEKQVRAKKGSTRIFVPITPEVQRFYNHLGRWFLHFSEPQNLGVSILPKSGRNQPREGEEPTKRACVYRRGVFVREVTSSSLPSLFDYQLDELDLNESRTFDDWQAKHAIGTALAAGKPEHLTAVFSAMMKNEAVFESLLDGYGLEPSYNDTAETTAAKAVNWQKALEAVGGEDAVLVGSEVDQIADMVKGKGFVPVRVKSEGWAKAAAAYGVKTEAAVLTQDDKEGVRFSEATPEVLWALDWVWKLCEEHNMTNGKEKPEAGCFYKHTQNGGQCFGWYRDGRCLIHEEISTGKVDFLLVAMVEEVCHHVSGGTDFSRDFQTFLVRFIVSLGKESLGLGQS